MMNKLLLNKMTLDEIIECQVIDTLEDQVDSNVRKYYKEWYDKNWKNFLIWDIDDVVQLVKYRMPLIDIDYVQRHVYTLGRIYYGTKLMD